MYKYIYYICIHTWRYMDSTHNMWARNSGMLEYEDNFLGIHDMYVYHCVSIL